MNKGITLILAILLLITGWYALNQKEAAYASSSIVSVMTDSIKYYENREGEMVSQNKALVITAKELKKNAEALKIDNKILRNLISQHKTKALSSGEGEVVDSDINVDIEPVDSLSGSFSIQGVYDWSNDYLFIDSSQYVVTGEYLFIDGKLSLNNSEFLSKFKHRYNLSFTTTTYWKRDPKWNVFKQKFAVTDIVFDDPNVVVTSNQSIIIAPSKSILNRKITWVVIGGVIVKIFLK